MRKPLLFIRKICIVCLIFSTSGWVAAQPVTPVWPQQLEQAVWQAREGDTDAALSKLANLLQQHPAQTQIRYDYAVVAAWHGDDALTVDLLQGLDAGTMPVYVLRVFARSARQAKHFIRAAALYDVLAAREGQFEAGTLGAALSLADAGDSDRAFTKLSELLATTDPSAQLFADLQFAHGYIYERNQNFRQALHFYNQGLRHHPDHAGLRHRRAIAASALGATAHAADVLQQAPALFSEAERVGIELDSAALQIRWADLYPYTGQQTSLQQVLADYQTLAPVAGERKITLQFDQFVAHVAAYEMQQALVLYEALLEQHGGMQQLPVYVLASAGRMFLYFDDPRAARDCLRTALLKGGDGLPVDARFGLQMGLFRAYADAGEFEQLPSLVSELRREQVPWQHPSPRIWIANERYPATVEALALERAYVEAYRDALRQMDAWLSIAPANGSLRLTRAAVLRWLQWYDHSLNDVELVQASGEYQLRALLARGHVAMDTTDFTVVPEVLDAATAIHPRDKGVVDLRKRWALHQRPEFYARADAGRSDGGAEGSRSHQIDTYLYSKPVAEQIRLFAHGVYRVADFDEGTGRDSRLGAGLEYRRKDLVVTGEINQGFEQYDGTGLALSTRWRLNDFWSLRASAALDSSNAPLRGVRAGISADEVTAGGAYRWHESRSLGFGVGAMRMQDGNQRRWLSLGLTQRLINATRHKLEAQLRAYMSRNTKAAAVYFNPERDRDLAVGLVHEWRIYQDAERRFSQRIGGSIGNYYQENFGSAGVWDMSVEHRWQLNAALNFSYGVRWGRRTYDGDDERQTSYFMTLGARI